MQSRAVAVFNMLALSYSATLRQPRVKVHDGTRVEVHYMSQLVMHPRHTSCCRNQVVDTSQTTSTCSCRHSTEERHLCMLSSKPAPWLESRLGQAPNG